MKRVCVELLIVLLLTICSFSCRGTTESVSRAVCLEEVIMKDKEVAILAGGCFWCIEAPIAMLRGVETVVSGYIGGLIPHPTYAQVCTGNTGHAEAVKITYDGELISYAELLEAFFLLHDPTQLNGQGNDIGTQYRSAIFPINKKQEEEAKYYLKALGRSKAYNKPIVTSIEYADVFYKAEDYHQEYYLNNPGEIYCKLIVKPKIDKFKAVFAAKLKVSKD